MHVLFGCSKDVNGFFAYPVTDSIAPGYSSIIHNPMDFSTMETKMERNEYRSVMEYKVHLQVVFSIPDENCWKSK
jgi:bromodomain-containing protein 7/9